ncbi:DUF2141 domain-containing protein [Aurantiacibacter aquimixticola]|uniref:DUF2141 domain-containing protein n=1 Tax=Aurantiacibacter aquimixticola TaxID=1958945 RepID=A0A419RX22_9SPHN|nr:DUF2141 domain-containing protein [Aurantiacibacter aquimixticola]RJY10312.1 DUF2141 domain-containing protein [Aurantiacibacter aquimixticola]
MKTKIRIVALATAAVAATALAAPAGAQQYRQELRHSVAPCQGSGPAVWINITGIEETRGTLRIQLYRGTRDDWLERGRWLNRIEVPARAGSMQVCMPTPAAGTYAIAIRHDLNGNGRTDMTQDGGGMSNNPSINIFNLGRPGVDRTRFAMGREVKSMTIRMRYM